MMPEFKQLIDPLQDILDQGPYWRLVVSANRVVAQAHGCAPWLLEEVMWSAEQHAQALGWLADIPLPVQLSPGVTLTLCGEALLFTSSHTLGLPIAGLVEQGFLSSLAAEMLQAALGLGLNILVAGPKPACVSLISGLVHGGLLPCGVGEASEVYPPTWLRVDTANQAIELGADRVACWSAWPQTTVEVLTRLTGCVAWLPAVVPEQALMRYELAAQAWQPQAQTPLYVLAGFSFLVVVTSHPRPWVNYIAEIVLTNDGYQPRKLFDRDATVAQGAALMPVAIPQLARMVLQHSFMQTDWVNQFQHALQDVSAPTKASYTAKKHPVLKAQVNPRVDVANPTDVVGQTEESLEWMTSAASDASPGWELDRLALEPVELAVMYGLEPPPCPETTRDIEQNEPEPMGAQEPKT